MKATRIILTLAIATLIFFASATTAYAQMLNPTWIAGNLYQLTVNGCNDPIIINLPDPSLVPLRSPDVTFLVRTNVSGIPLDFDDTYDKNGHIVEAWLATPGSSNHAWDIRGFFNIRYNYMSDYPCTFVTVIDFTGEVTVVTVKCLPLTSTTIYGWKSAVSWWPRRYTQGHRFQQPTQGPAVPSRSGLFI